MAGNALLTIDMITREAVRLFKNSNLFIMNMDTQYDGSFAIDGAKIGQILRIRLPNDYVVTDGAAYSPQATSEQYTTLEVTSQKNVGIAFTTAERTMSVDDYSEIVLAPAINNLCGKVAQTVMNASEGGACNFISNVDASAALNAVSATGKIITPTSKQYLRANAILDNQGADGMTRRVVNDPNTDADMTNSLQGLLNPTPEISAQFRTGNMKSGLGYERWFRDQTVITHTSGTFSAGGTVTPGGQTTAVGGGNILVNAITGTLKKGDIITFAGVNGVNRTTKQDQGVLRQFVVTADVLTGATTIPIYPAMIPQGAGGVDVQYQTVVTSPINGAAMVLASQSGEVYQKCLAYAQKAITMATADLVMPTRAVENAARAEYDGISLRILTDYFQLSDQLGTRIDVLFGQRYIRPEWVTIVAGAL